MQKLPAQAVAAGATTIDPDTLATQIQRYRLAVQVGISQTAARPGNRALRADAGSDRAGGCAPSCDLAVSEGATVFPDWPATIESFELDFSLLTLRKYGALREAWAERPAPVCGSATGITFE